LRSADEKRHAGSVAGEHAAPKAGVTAWGNWLKLRREAVDRKPVRPVITALERATRLLLSVVARLSTERGQTMAEYGILIAVIAVVVIVAAETLGGSLSGLFHNASTKV
jgi:pilus assembly protein Flp/PilA